jgi:hypothetical protein
MRSTLERTMSTLLTPPHQRRRTHMRKWPAPPLFSSTARSLTHLREVRRALALFKGADMAIFAGRLLAAGMWACADLAERARARRDEQAVADAADAADGLATWVERMSGVPFTDHRYVATIPAERATWEAERRAR